MTASASSGLDSVAILVCLGIVCFFAVLLNLMVIVVLLWQRKTNTDYYMINLSVSDIVLAGISIPIKLSIAANSNEDFTGGDFTCKVLMFTPIFSVMCSILSMVAIAIDRTIVVVHNKTTKLASVAVAIVIIWLLSIATSAPQIYEYSVYTKFEEEENKTEISCGSHGIAENFETVYASVILTVAYIIPLSILTICYSQIGVYIWKTSKAVQKTSTDDAIWKKRVRVVKMLFIITVLFAVLWAPYFVLFVRSEITGEDDTSHGGSWQKKLEIIMIALSSISNPLVYIIYNRDFRSNLVRVTKCEKGNSVHPSLGNQTQVASRVKPSTARNE